MVLIVKRRENTPPMSQANHQHDVDGRIRVKFLLKHPMEVSLAWRRQLPDSAPSWGRCEFCFDAQAREYDWLVVYDELPPQGEELACPRSNTILVTAEPSSIKVYGSAYLEQFGAVLTGHESWALQHPNKITHQPGLQWFVGRPHSDPSKPIRTYDQFVERAVDAGKTRTLSTVCSNKRMGHTLHATRYDFVQLAKAEIPEMDVFGHGVRPIEDKAEALDAYRYHLAIENHQAPHHITEKLTDTFLAGALPFYFGATRAADYFPADSFIPIDIRKPHEAIATIQRAIQEDQYTKRIDAIHEAKRRVLEEQNLFAILAHQIDRLDTGKRGSDGSKLINRRVFRRRHPIGALRYLAERYRVLARAKRESGV
jgi:Arc/MetJ-type ribon-helix-helix transcriptional regulator